MSPVMTNSIRAGRRDELPEPREWPKSQSDRVVELHGDDETDAPIGRKKAQRGAESIERLADIDAPKQRASALRRGVRFEQAEMARPIGAGQQRHADQEDVEPIKQKRCVESYFC